MAKLAIVLHEGVPAKQHILLAKTLDFFGVPFKFTILSAFPESGKLEDQVVFGSASAIATAYQRAEVSADRIGRHAAFYAFADNDRPAAESGIRMILGDARLALREAPAGFAAIQISPLFGEIVGPMSGIEVRVRMREEDAVLAGIDEQQTKIVPIISAAGAPVYLRVESGGVPIYLCASSFAADIDEEVEAGYYDVKEHLCSAVPLISFIRLMFREVAWQPQEIGACLIIDDPLLRRRYGCCDFERLRRLMQQYGFTTNIAFIPWNWRRTSATASNLFGNGSGDFSVSIHGCDHVKAEFGDLSPSVLDNRAKLAQARMRMHEHRTGIHHDPVMVFPQGIFSSACPGILKRNGFIAAVNTQTSPMDSDLGRTRIRDIWDVAIMKYGDFPVFTRRYADHGIENFAFDLLLGKPCLIAAHHEFFKDDCSELIGLLDSLHARKCDLKWRPLGEAILRACRRRTDNAGVIEVEMYGTELTLSNSEENEIHAVINRKESDPKIVTQILSDRHPVQWNTQSDGWSVETKLAAHSDRHFRVCYRELDDIQAIGRSVIFRSSVAARRILSEFANAYVGRSTAINVRKTRPLTVQPDHRLRTNPSASSEL